VILELPLSESPNASRVHERSLKQTILQSPSGHRAVVSVQASIPMQFKSQLPPGQLTKACVQASSSTQLTIQFPPGQAILDCKHEYCSELHSTVQPKFGGQAICDL